MKNLYYVAFLWCNFSVLPLLAHQHLSENNSLKLIKNLGQLPDAVLYSTEINGGAVYLENNTLTYTFYNQQDLDRISRYIHNNEYLQSKTDNSPSLRGHAYKVHFKNANATPVVVEQNKCTEYHNYFLGSDKSKWAGNVPLFKSIEYQNIYSQIDLKVYSAEAQLKYDFIVHRGADAADIVLSFEGADGLAVEERNLKISTSVADITEQKPYAYQWIDGVKREVPCHYRLRQNHVSFAFPQGYNRQYDLVIDPVIVAATYSGTTYRAYANTATYDLAGNIYSGGRAFSVNANGSGAGYPVTTGAFQITHAGGYQDICISKYNPDASQLIWATYIGGNKQEQPNSMVVDNQQQLYIYGSSNSPNYPTTAGAFKTSNPADNFGNILNDIIVTKLNASGTALLGSTYVGGRTESDGVSWSTMLRYYGDYNKGEIVIDSAGNAYVASCTWANDFPATGGVIQPAFSGGNQDGVVFKLNSSLTTMAWATFYGGPADDACYGLKLDNAGNIFVTGATSSNFQSNTSGTIHSGYQGGLFDAFVAHISANGQSVIKSTYFGSVNEEQAYLLDLDKNGYVYIFGATPNSSIQPTPGAYQAVLNGSFISKISPALDSLCFITTFNQVAPTALMVDECNYIYAVGHGGLNNSIGTLTGFATTSNAFQTGSGGFYLLTLEPDATGLKFGSYYGPQESHVDGGTCRFDKRGVIYHALCTDKTTLYTTPTAVHPTNLSNDFDNTVFKIDFQASKVTASALAVISGGTDTTVSINSCQTPLSVQFINHSQNATEYVWYFGNGDSSTLAQPVYNFSATGTYPVMLVAKNPNTCNLADTAYLSISTSGNVSLTTNGTTTTCTGNTGNVSVNATGTGTFSYLWNTGDTTSAVSNLPSGTYTVTVTASGNCTATATATVSSTNGVTVTISATGTTCGNNNGTASVTTGGGTSPFSYLWNNGAATLSINNLSSGTYTVTVTDDNHCSATAQVTVLASNPINATISSNKSIMCSGDSALICAPGGYTSYLWNTGQSDSCIYTKLAGNYYVTVTDQANCTAASNHLAVNVHPLPPVSISVNGDTLVAYNSVTYQWYYNGNLIQGATAPLYIAAQAGYYMVAVTDSNGCAATSIPVEVGTVGVSCSAQNFRWSVSPNPGKGIFEIRITDYSGTGHVLAELFDVTGRKVLQQPLVSSVTVLDLRQVMSAVYFLKVSGSGLDGMKKIIKE